MRSLTGILLLTLSVFWGAAPVVGQQIGDRVVVIKNTDKVVGSQMIDRISMGNSFVVQAINGKWLWPDYAVPGWIDKNAVMPLKDAASYFTAAIHNDPNNPLYYQARGNVRQYKAEYDLAIEDFTSCLRLADTNKDAVYMMRAETWAQKGEPEIAIADYNEAIRLRPGSPQYLSRRGDFLMTIGAYGEALRDLQEAIRLDPKNAHPYQLRAVIFSSCPDDRIRDGKRALTDAKTACQLTNWKAGFCLDALAAAYAELGQFDEAIKWETEALRLAPPEYLERTRNSIERYKAKTPSRLPQRKK